jgi:hypothetical protein
MFQGRVPALRGSSPRAWEHARDAGTRTFVWTRNPRKGRSLVSGRRVAASGTLGCQGKEGSAATCGPPHHCLELRPSELQPARGVITCGPETATPGVPHGSLPPRATAPRTLAHKFNRGSEHAQKWQICAKAMAHLIALTAVHTRRSGGVSDGRALSPPFTLCDGKRRRSGQALPGSANARRW